MYKPENIKVNSAPEMQKKPLNWIKLFHFKMVY